MIRNAPGFGPGRCHFCRGGRAFNKLCGSNRNGVDHSKPLSDGDVRSQSANAGTPGPGLCSVPAGNTIPQDQGARSARAGQHSPTSRPG